MERGRKIGFIWLIKVICIKYNCVENGNSCVNGCVTNNIK